MNWIGIELIAFDKLIKKRVLKGRKWEKENKKNGGVRWKKMAKKKMDKTEKKKKYKKYKNKQNK